MDVVVAVQKEPSSKKIINHDFTIYYYPESDDAKVPFKATYGSAAYDLYVAEGKNILPKSAGLVSLDLRMMIPKGFYGKIFSRLGLFLNNLITAECGVIDSDNRGIVHVCLFDHSDEVFSVKVGQRITRIVFMEKFDVEFKMVQSRDSLQKSERNEGGFGSTGNNRHFFIIYFIEKIIKFLIKKNGKF